MDLTDIDKMITDIRIKNLRYVDRNDIDTMLYELQSALFKKQDEANNLDIPVVSVAKGTLPYDLCKEIRECPECKILPGLCASHEF